MPGRLLRRFDALAKASAYAGMGALLVAMLLTVADIVLRKSGIFTWSGTIDVVQLCIMATAFLVIPYTFANDGHVAVDLLAGRLPRRLQAALRAVAAALGLVFMGLVAWYGWHYAAEQVGYGDRSQTIGIPIVWYWAPLIIGALLSMLATLLVGLRYLGIALTGRDRTRPPTLVGR